jgi:tetratricopeptide (TPR) repeat protein
MKKIILFVSMLIVIACSQNKRDNQYSAASQTNREKAISLNNKAMEIVKQESLDKRVDTSDLEIAVALLDSAIIFDSTNYVSYTNKASILCGLRRVNEAINIMKRITNLRPSYAEGMDFLGMIYESEGRIAEANNEYKRALQIYQDRHNRGRTFPTLQQVIFSHMMLNERIIADSLLKRAYFEYPSEVNGINKFKEYLSTFNRQDYMSNKTK